MMIKDQLILNDFKPEGHSQLSQTQTCILCKTQHKNNIQRINSITFSDQQSKPKHCSDKKVFINQQCKQQGSQISTFCSTSNQIISQQFIQPFQTCFEDVIIKGDKNYTPLAQKIEQRLSSHWGALQKSDKYFRMLCAILKTYRAYHPNTSINLVYKELILTRRVIRLQSKYSTFRDFLTKEESKGMKMFKVMQLMGDLCDWSSLWMLIYNRGTKKYGDKIQFLEQCQSNFYFLQCCIWLVIYLKRLIALKLSKQDSLNEKDRNNKMTQNSLKSLKYLLDVFTSYNNSSFAKRFGQYNLKISGYLTICSSIIGLMLLWR